MDILNSVKYVYDYVKYSFNVSRNDLMDPLTVIYRLIILSYKPTGTKISIQNNKILLQNNSFIQGPLRSIYGDKNTDINILYGPIIFTCIHYLMGPSRKDFIELFKYASIGLSKLKETYLGRDITYNIDQIKNIIDSFIQNEDIDPSNFVANYQSQIYKLKTDIYKHIETVWDDDKHKTMINLINELINSNDNIRDNIILSINSYLDHIDTKVSEIIKGL